MRCRPKAWLAGLQVLVGYCRCVPYGIETIEGVTRRGAPRTNDAERGLIGSDLPSNGQIRSAAA